VSSAVDQSDQSHFGPGGADTTVVVVRRSVGDSVAVRAIHGAGSALARTPQSDGTHLSLNNPDLRDCSLNVPSKNGVMFCIAREMYCSFSPTGAT
jgi:hypothetical protein